MRKMNSFKPRPGTFYIERLEKMQSGWRFFRDLLGIDEESQRDTGLQLQTGNPIATRISRNFNLNLCTGRPLF